jgi:hypothetical protein
VHGERLLLAIDNCHEHLLEITSTDDRIQLKTNLTEQRTRWHTYQSKQTQFKQVVHQIELEQIENDQRMNDIMTWIDEYRRKMHELTIDLNQHDENRQRLYQLKAFVSELHGKQMLVRTWRTNLNINQHLTNVDEQLDRFNDELHVRIELLNK